MTQLNQNHIVVIEELAKYKFLTSSQFVKLKLYKKRGYLTNAVKPLLDMKKPLIAKQNFNPLYGRLESIYYLTKYGKQFLIDELDYSESEIKVPKSLAPIYIKDYFHRKYTIDFHIFLSQWIESENEKLLFLNYYFDKSGSNRCEDKSKYVYALNKIDLNSEQSFIPDINLKLSSNKDEYIYLFEQHNGKDAKRLLKQLSIHILAIADGVVSKKYNSHKAHRVVVVCEEESVKTSVIKRLQKLDNIEFYNKNFIFKTNLEVQMDFFNNWTLINEEKTNFLLQ